MDIDLSFSDSIFKVRYDTQVDRFISEKDLLIQENAVRMLSDMNILFRDLETDFEDEPLYYMMDGVCYSEHKDLFDKNNLKYEYTVLLPKLIAGEYLKTHGHIHYVKDCPNKGMMEMMEVVHGKGYFLLFLPGNNGFNITIVEVKRGDRFIVPKQYYHLTINVGNEPFIFSDIISQSTGGDYNLLKQKQGAPLLVFKDNAGGFRYEWNKNYPPIEKVKVCDIYSLPYEQAFTIDGPLYDNFISDPSKFEILNEPY